MPKRSTPLRAPLRRHGRNRRSVDCILFLQGDSVRKLVFIIAGLGLILSFQNCAPPKPAESGHGEYSLPGEAADHDPLSLNGKTTGPLYVLERSDDDLGDLTLQFSAELDVAEPLPGQVEAAVLKRLSFTSSDLCGGVLSGRGHISRFRNIPARAGVLNFEVTEESIGTLGTCPPVRDFLESVDTF